MNFLLDTNVISEWMKASPAPQALAWLSKVDEDRLFVSVVTLAEVRRGIEILPAGVKRARLDDWASAALPGRFEGRVLPVSAAIAEGWGRLSVRAEMLGRKLTVMDGFIAATAQTQGFSLVTRNVRDFDYLGIEMFNPWEI